MAHEDNLFALLGDEELEDLSNLIESIKKENDPKKESAKQRVQKEKKEEVQKPEPIPFDTRAKPIILPKKVMRSYVVFDKKKQREEEEAKAKANGSTDGSVSSGSENNNRGEAKSICSSERTNGDFQGGCRPNSRNGNGYSRNNGGYNGYPIRNWKNNGGSRPYEKYVDEQGFVHHVRRGSTPPANLLLSESNNFENNDANEVEKDSGKSVDGDNKEEIPKKAVELVAQGEENGSESEKKSEKEDISKAEQARLDEIERRRQEIEAYRKLKTLKQYEEELAKRKSSKAAKTFEQRKVDDKAFESMKIVGKKKEDIQIVLKTENKPKKKDNPVQKGSQKPEEKKMSIEEFMKFAEAAEKKKAAEMRKTSLRPNNRSGGERKYNNNGQNRNHYQQNGSRPYAGRNYNGEWNNNQQQIEKKHDLRPNGGEANQPQQVAEKLNDRPNGEMNDSRRNNYRQNGEKDDVAPAPSPLPPTSAHPNLEDALFFPVLLSKQVVLTPAAPALPPKNNNANVEA